MMLGSPGLNPLGPPFLDERESVNVMDNGPDGRGNRDLLVSDRGGVCGCVAIVEAPDWAESVSK
jgi:hypothetical protein